MTDATLQIDYTDAVHKLSEVENAIESLEKTLVIMNKYLVDQRALLPTIRMVYAPENRTYIFAGTETGCLNYLSSQTDEEWFVYDRPLSQTGLYRREYPDLGDAKLYLSRVIFTPEHENWASTIRLHMKGQEVA